MSVLNFLRKNFINILGWKINRKLLVIESDDWGSIRMRSNESRERLISKGIPVDSHYFASNDTLETDEDLHELIDVLSGVHDHLNRNPVITCNAVVANPDFDAIRRTNFLKYIYEPVDESFRRNAGRSANVINIYRDCVAKNSFLKLQFHGREHLNVRKWLMNLRNGLPYDLVGFDEGCLLGIVQGEQIYSRDFYQAENYMAGFEVLDKTHESEIETITRDGLALFKNIFGFAPLSFAAQSLIWGNHLNSVLKDEGVKYIQGAQQFVPLGNGRIRVKNHFSGYKNSEGQLLWRRNASFEPAANPKKNWVDSCLAEISIAFRWNSPAIINSHRVNFMGGIKKSNRENSLTMFRRLLLSITKKWPDVEFISSEELGNIMSAKK